MLISLICFKYLLLISLCLKLSNDNDHGNKLVTILSYFSFRQSEAPHFNEFPEFRSLPEMQLIAEVF